MVFFFRCGICFTTIVPLARCNTWTRALYLARPASVEGQLGNDGIVDGARPYTLLTVLFLLLCEWNNGTPSGQRNCLGLLLAARYLAAPAWVPLLGSQWAAVVFSNEVRDWVLRVTGM